MTRRRILPQYRTLKYAIWKACERLRVLPPDIQSSWDDNLPIMQATILAYSQIRDYEDQESANSMLKAFS